MRKSPNAALHRLNGVMIQHLRKLMPECPWHQWVINAIILHRTLGAVETVTLETSATLYEGALYDGEEDIGETKPVTRLDGPVPLDSSYTGYCIRTGRIVWIDDLPSLTKPSHDRDPLQGQYRSFGYVGVQTRNMPKAEYVFPIRLRVGLSDSLWGALNCEWYVADPDAPDQRSHFQEIGPAIVMDSVGQLLDVHARFLPAVMNPDDASKENAEGFFAYYSSILDRLVENPLMPSGNPQRGRQ